MKAITDDMIMVLKAVRKANREREIALYGKPICFTHIAENKKKYTRKRKHKGSNCFS